jgi:hypothetical protein
LREQQPEGCTLNTCLKRDAVCENKTDNRARSNAGQICWTDRQSEASDQDAHEEKVAAYRKKAARKVKLRQPAKRFIER